MSYEMKKSLRKGAGSKSYAEPDEDGQPVNEANRQKDMQKESIFQHKNWSPKQKVKLMIFLSHYHELPDWNSERRSIHLYKHLSNFLKKSRTPEQCKNIHSLLKRKFNSLEEVVDAMERELHSEENYPKFLTKYERQIEKFQNQHCLFGGANDYKRTLEPLRSRKILFREQKEQARATLVKQYEQSEQLKIKVNDNIKHQDIQFDKSFNRLAQECQFYFNEWLKCVSVIEYKNKTQSQF